MTVMKRFDSPFVFSSGTHSIIKPQHLGIAGSRVCVLTPHDSATAMNTLQAPPYTNSGFFSELRVCGESVPADEWKWCVNAIYRRGCINNAELSSLTVILPEADAVVQRIKLKNTGCEYSDICLDLWLGGSAGYLKEWIFSSPPERKDPPLTIEASTRQVLYIYADDVAFCVTASVGMSFFSQANILSAAVGLNAGEEICLFFSFHLGALDDVRSETERISGNYEAQVRAALSWFSSREKELLSAVPVLECENKSYTDFYYRSLVTLLMNRWENPRLFSQPYYSTGSTTGGCMCSYLWDFAGTAKLLPLCDPDAAKKMIEAFLSIDLSAHYAVMPIDGAGTGPWYQINQEKIVYMIYYYIAHTGDSAFLRKTVCGKTVAEWVDYHASFGDNPDTLIDYGEKGEDHLELKKGYPYHGVMPDLNMRRCLTYLRAAELAEISGCSGALLRTRAAELYALANRELWDAEKKWFAFLCDGKKQYRYTVQMFKFLNLPLLDDEIRNGLLSHLNEKEFLSKFGLHSMSKLDEAYDQIDIDNGGGGICSLFVPVILEQLFDIGEGRLAWDILHRVLWWGERMPYWGDSFVANAVAYREDTPLQATIGSSAGAQMYVFGVFGVRVAIDGKITVAPKTPPPEKMTLKNVRLRGKTFTVSLDRDSFRLYFDGKALCAPYGKSLSVC